MKRYLLLTLALCSAAAIAAPQPHGGTLGDGSGQLGFVGGPFYVPNVTSDAVYLGDPPDQPRQLLVCKRNTMNCDRFALTVNLSDSARQIAAAQGQVLTLALDVQEQQPLTVVKPEFHLYLIDANGQHLGRSDQAFLGATSYRLDVPLRSVPNGRYTVVVTGYNGLGATYAATVGLGAAE